MNNMKRVATEILGLEWDDDENCSEEFRYKGQTYHFVQFGLCVLDNKLNLAGGVTWNDSDKIEDILNSPYEITKQPWNPENGKECWFIDIINRVAFASVYSKYRPYDVNAYYLGLISKTKQQAQAKLDYYTKLIKDNPYKEGLE